MIPQAYALQIQVTTGGASTRYMVVGWRDYSDTFRPVVVPLDDLTKRAVTLPEGVEWKVRTWA